VGDSAFQTIKTAPPYNTLLVKRTDTFVLDRILQKQRVHHHYLTKPTMTTIEKAKDIDRERPIFWPYTGEIDMWR
jgi:hypothetical protein